MAVSQISKFYILAHLSIKNPLLNELQKLGCVEITHCDKDIEFRNWNNIEESIDSDTTSSLNNVKYCIDLLSDYGNDQNSGLNSFLSSKKPYQYSDFVEVSRQYDYKKLHSQCKKLDNELSSLKLEENRLISTRQEVQQWHNLELDLKEIEQYRLIKIILGTIAKAHFNKFKTELENIKTNYIQVVKEEKNKVYAALIVLKENLPKIEPVLQKYNFDVYKYNYSINGTPTQILNTISKELNSIDTRRGEIEQTLSKLKEDNEYIYPLYDFLCCRQEKEDIKKYFKKSDNTVVIKGWIQNKDIPKLENYLEKHFTIYDIYFTEPKKDEDVPVALVNNKFTKPFEIITQLYSLPNYHEYDPTPILAIFYFIFFGLCLSDVGYGASLAILSYIAMKKLKLEEGAKTFFKLFFYCGISGMFGGILVGSWFGDILNYLPPIFNNLKNILVQGLALFEPSDNPIPLLILSLALGVIQIYTGIILNFIDNVKNGNFLDGLMDQVSWLFLLSGLILLLAKGMLPAPIGKAALFIFLIGVISIVLTQGRTKSNILLKFGSGVLALYDITGYFSDILSYSRLFALGLTTGIIAQMFNMLASMVKIPYIGFIITIIILIIGHSFNLLISVLSSFIHDARLQYVEFFTKFYKAGGTAFRPFTLNTKYIKLEDIDN